MSTGLPSSSKPRSVPPFLSPPFPSAAAPAKPIPAQYEHGHPDDRADRHRRTRRRRDRQRHSQILPLRQEGQDRRERRDGLARRGVVRRGVPGDEGGQAGLTGLSGLQADLREAQELTRSALTSGGSSAKPSASWAPLALARDTNQRRSRWAWVRGAGHSSWMAALTYAPSMTAKPAKKANKRNAIGVASPPQVWP